MVFLNHWFEGEIVSWYFSFSSNLSWQYQLCMKHEVKKNLAVKIWNVGKWQMTECQLDQKCGWWDVFGSSGKWSVTPWTPILLMHTHMDTNSQAHEHIHDPLIMTNTSYHGQSIILYTLLPNFCPNKQRLVRHWHSYSPCLSAARGFSFLHKWLT